MKIFLKIIFMTFLLISVSLNINMYLKDLGVNQMKKDGNMIQKTNQIYDKKSEHMVEVKIPLGSLKFF